MKTLLETIETIKKRKDLYYNLNNEIRDLQGDFPTYLTAIDVEIESAIVKYLNEQIKEICGLEEMASYYLYECDGKEGGAIHCLDSEKEFRIKTINDLKRVINYFSKKLKNKQ